MLILLYFEFIITQQIPDIKVIDFITGIFRMFNLTAYVERITNIIVVKPLDDFYSSGQPYDITKYIVSDTSSVDVALPYREIYFDYEDTNTFLAKHTRPIIWTRYGRRNNIQKFQQKEHRWRIIRY
jgi:hypothetical protein